MKMLSIRFHTKRFLYIQSLLLLTIAATAHTAHAQEPQTNQDERKKAIELFRANQYEQALPLIQNLALANPNDSVMQEELGGCLLAHAVNLPDLEERQKIRLQARQAFLRAKELGDKSNYLLVMLEKIPEDGSDVPYSNRKEVDALMRDAEATFSRGDFAAALDKYSQVLKLDPQNYEAPLFSGDVYFKQKDYENSYKWFAKAVETDPNRETAYRYWGDALYAAGKNAEARQKFIEAVVASPYQKQSWVGLTQWAGRNHVTLSQPKIESPNSMTTDGGKVNITVDPNSLTKKDGSSGWMFYEITRARWKEKKFHEQFPQEKEYRHSLAEESDALGLVASAVSERQNSQQSKFEDLNPQLATLIKLKSEGLLESYILLGRPDQGIAQDYAVYRKDHRDKLIQYMNEYVVPQVK